jgi:hypothetical protein
LSLSQTANVALAAAATRCLTLPRALVTIETARLAVIFVDFFLVDFFVDFFVDARGLLADLALFFIADLGTLRFLAIVATSSRTAR